MNKGQLALDLFNKGYNCAQAVVLAFKEELNLDEKTLKSMSSSFGGGISRLREVCGCVSGAGIVLGLMYGDYDVNNVDEKAAHYAMIQNISLKFKQEFNSYICATLLNKASGVESPIPSVRNENYYVNRPCGKYIYYMANLIEKELANHGKN